MTLEKLDRFKYVLEHLVEISPYESRDELMSLADQLTGSWLENLVEVERLSQASHRAWSLLKKVLDDEESRPGAWGPDITMLRFIKEAQAAIEKGPQP